MQQWISIKDRMPEDEVTVLVLCDLNVGSGRECEDPEELVYFVGARYRGEWVNSSIPQTSHYPAYEMDYKQAGTHWMPLPEYLRDKK